MPIKKIKKNEKGVLGIAMIGIFAFLFTLAAVIYTTTIFEISSSTKSQQRQRALEAAEGGIDYAIYTIKSGVTVLAGNPILPSFPGTCYDSTSAGAPNYTSAVFRVCWQQTGTILVGTVNEPVIRIVANGYVPNPSVSHVKRRVEARYHLGSSATTINFNDSVFTDCGGIQTDGTSTIKGTVRSNGPVSFKGDQALITDVKVYDGANICNTSNDYELSGVPYNLLRGGPCNITTDLNLAIAKGNCTQIGSAGTATKVYAQKIQGIFVEGDHLLDLINCTASSSLDAARFGKRVAPNATACDAASGQVPEFINPLDDGTIGAWVIQVQTTAGAVCDTVAEGCSVPTVAKPYPDFTGCPPTSIGPLEILGDMTLNAGCNIELTGTVYVHGDIKINGGASITVDCITHSPTTGEVIIGDKNIKISSASVLAGDGSDITPPVNACTGSTTSYLLVVSRRNVESNPSQDQNISDEGITNSGSSTTVILAAPHSWINMSGGTGANVAASWGVNMTGGSTIIFLAPISFTKGGPTTVSFNNIYFNNCQPFTDSANVFHDVITVGLVMGTCPDFILPPGPNEPGWL